MRIFFFIVAYLCKVEVGHMNNACHTDTQPNMAFKYRCDACPFIPESALMNYLRKKKKNTSPCEETARV